ncbi:hypothetical protein, variant [Puccinia triticina 1-1 BBBD Race 1]|uniref:Uncharacterized protein n=1 Tax=Puccinia triticina (isolate 1-1 / race 1 (BBBD)) TaxID=630390 RepID=A0A180GQ50_PUCT1|nr:hypothetical protein, variant [Puccinia triticina 1-1 BBBD Race 1]
MRFQDYHHSCLSLQLLVICGLKLAVIGRPTFTNDIHLIPEQHTITDVPKAGVLHKKMNSVLEKVSPTSKKSIPTPGRPGFQRALDGADLIEHLYKVVATELLKNEMKPLPADDGEINTIDELEKLHGTVHELLSDADLAAADSLPAGKIEIMMSRFREKIRPQLMRYFSENKDPSNDLHVQIQQALEQRDPREETPNLRKKLNRSEALTRKKVVEAFKNDIEQGLMSDTEEDSKTLGTERRKKNISTAIFSVFRKTKPDPQQNPASSSNVGRFNT